MPVKQISVFIENKEGRIKKVVNIISKAGINIRALSIADNTKYGILRLIVSDTEKAKEVLKSENFIVKESNIILVKIEDKPNGLNEILDVFEDAKINLEYLYAFVAPQIGKAMAAMRVEDYENGINALKKVNANIILTDDDFKNNL